MAARSHGEMGALGVAFAPFKPVLWVAGIGIILLAIVVGWMSMRTGTKATGPALLVLSEKDAETLTYGLDVQVRSYATPPTEVKNKGVNVRQMHVVSFRPGVSLKSPATLRFPAPIDMKFPAAEPTGPGALQVCHFLREGRIWTKIAATWVGRPDVLYEALVLDEGYYGLVEITGPQTRDDIPEPPKPDADKAKPQEPPSQSPKLDPSKYRFAPVMHWKATGGWEEVSDFQLCITPEKPTVRIDDVPVVSVWGATPSFLNGTQTAYWYMSEADALLDIPQEVRMLSDPDCFKFRLPTSLAPGEYTIVFRVVDTVADEAIGVVCEAKIPVTITE